MRLIKKIKDEPSKSSKLKRDHYAQIGVIEVFLEATPSAFVFMILIVSTVDNVSLVDNGVDDEGLALLLRGPMDGTFWGTFSLHYSYCLVDPQSSLLPLEWQGGVEIADKK